MGRTFDSIDDRLRAFLEAQRIFFVATAPAGPDGHVNVSPKGGDSLRILDERTVAYLDRVGSGVETIAHVRENGRIALLFCAFEGPPRIVRLHGRGEVLEPVDERFARLRDRFPPSPDGAARAILVVRVERASESCGFGVPLFHYEGERPHLDDWAVKKGPEALEGYQRQKNARSVDGLPALRWAGD